LKIKIRERSSLWHTHYIQFFELDFVIFTLSVIAALVSLERGLLLTEANCPQAASPASRAEARLQRPE